MAMTRGNFPRLLESGLRAVWGHVYGEHPMEFTRAFETRNSSRAYEEDQQITGFGLASVKSEGSSIAYDTEQQGFLTRYNHATYGLGFVITEEMMEDDQYAEVGDKRTRGLAFSVRQTQETVAGNVFNRAFNSAYTGGDAVEMCGTHLNASGGTFANELATAADLSETSLEQACIDIGKFKDDRGKYIAVMPDMLIVPVDLQFEAERILGSTLRSGTADNDVNALRSLSKMPGGVLVNHYLTDTDAWFIKTNCPNGLMHFERRAPQFESDNDFDTANAKFKATFRASWGWTDPRGVFGSPGS